MRIPLLLTCFLGVGVSSLAGDPGIPFVLGGIQVNEPDHSRWMKSLKSREMNSVSITVYAKQGAWNTDHLWFEEEEASVISEIRAARRAGVRVVLIPRVALDHAYKENRQLWHGMIMPASERQLQSWFTRYRSFLLKWARIAEDEGVELFAVGSELKSLTRTIPSSEWEMMEEIREFEFWYQQLPDRAASSQAPPDRKEAYRRAAQARSAAYLKWADGYYGPRTGRASRLRQRREMLAHEWKRTIRDLRREFSGLLTYAANFDAYQDIGFWADLDIMGINAYFKHREGLEQPDTAELRKLLNDSWNSIFSDLRSFRQTQGLAKQPVIFTEIGYTNRRHATVEPWSYTGQSVVEWNQRPFLIDWEQQPVDHTERTEAIAALQRIAARPENHFFRGLLYWKLSTDSSHREIEPFVVHIGPGSRDPVLNSFRHLRRAMKCPLDG